MNYKNDLLFLSYLEGIPDSNVGGPNHVIYDYLKQQTSLCLQIDFLSYGSYIENLDISKIDFSQEYLRGIKRITNGLFYKSKIFRNIVTSDLYLPIHFKKREIYFNKTVNNKKYRIIHSHDSIALSFSKLHLNTKRVMTVHNYCPYSNDFTKNIKNNSIRTSLFNTLRIKEIESLNLSNVVTFPSKAVKEFYETEISIDPNKDIRIIYNGIDLESINNVVKKNISDITKTSEKYDLVILSVASHERNKRLDIALNVIKELVHIYKKKVLFINVGRGVETKRLMEMTKTNYIENNVFFIDRMNHEEIIGLMKACDIFLHTAEKVVFDLVILEAMASGLCVVASDEGGNKEIINHMHNGYLIKLTAIDEYAKCIINANAEQIRSNAFLTIRNYTARITAEQYSKVYEELL